MPQLIAEIPDIRVGDACVILFNLTVNDVAVPVGVAVQAAIVSIDLTTTLIAAVECDRHTPPLTRAGQTYEWSATFTGSQTRLLLTEPTNLGSKLVRSIPKPESGFAQALLEIQAGLLPAPVTRHCQVSIEKGLIP